MANIKSIGGNPIVLGLDGLTDDAKAALGDSMLSATSESLLGAYSTAQWTTRESTGSGAATVRSVQGASVVWNQYAPLFFSASGWVNVGSNVTRTISDDGSSTTLTSNNNSTAAIKGIEIRYDGLATNHVWYIACTVDATHTTSNPSFGIYKHTENGAYRIVCEAGTNKRYSGIGTTEDPEIVSVRLAAATASGEYATFSDFVAIDLTAMFGAGNEPTTVEEFEAMYPEPYYPYSTPTLKPVQIAGIASTDAQGGELDAIEWTAQTLRAAGSVRDMLYSDHVDVRVGATVIDPTVDGVEFASVAEPNAAGLYSHQLTYTAAAWAATGLSAGKYSSFNYLTDIKSTLGASELTSFAQAITAGLAVLSSNRRIYLRWPSPLTEQELAALVASGGNDTLFYPLATPTTTPISPELSMTYRVEQGGTESVIVPDGEISAVPLITLAEGESAGELVMDALACIAAPDGPVATANHAINTYLTMQGKLYKVTSAIAVGETIVAGTNVTATTVMDEILALN